MKKKFQKMLILAFEVIVQPPKTHFLTFSKVQKHIMEKKSETKIMKITHSVENRRKEGIFLNYFMRQESVFYQKTHLKTLILIARLFHSKIFFFLSTRDMFEKSYKKLMQIVCAVSNCIFGAL